VVDKVSKRIKYKSKKANLINGKDALVQQQYTSNCCSDSNFVALLATVTLDNSKFKTKTAEIF